MRWLRVALTLLIGWALVCPAGHASAQTDGTTPRADTPSEPASEPASGPASEPASGPASEPAPRIVLYTMGKGDVLWQKFGHGALCVEYAPAERRHSLCYNYGTTDFTRPVSVGWGFLRGLGEFWVSVTTLPQMIRQYQAFDRTLWRQVLPLDDQTGRQVADRLATNALPANRNYTYHHFYDNCTTRIRDIIDDATDGALRAGAQGKPGPTFREYSRQGFSQDVWLLVVTDFVLGRGADKAPDLWQAMFLPRYLREQVRASLGIEPVVIYQRRGPPLTQGDSSGRGWLVLFALVLAAPLALARWRERYQRSALAFAVVPLTLIAVLIWFLAVVTAVQEFRYNEILLLYWPTDVALLTLSPQRRRNYARVRVFSVVLVSLLRAVGVFTQPLWGPALLVFLPMFILALPGDR